MLPARRFLVSSACALLCAVAACSRGDRSRASPELAVSGRDTAGAFLVMSERDTMALEHYARSPGRVQGTIVHGDGTRIQYDASVGPDEAITRLELRLWHAGSALDSRPAQQSITELRGSARDSLVRTDREAGAPRVFRMNVPPGTQPYLIPSVGLAQQALRRARFMGGPSVELSLVVLNGAALTQRVRVRWLPRDSAEIAVGNNRVRMGLDAEGRIRDGADPALGITVRRVPAR